MNFDVGAGLTRFVVPVHWRKQRLRVSGLARQGTGRTVVCLHGIQSCAELFLPLLQAPALVGRPAVSLDLLGFGLSDKPLDFSYAVADQAAIVSEALSSLDVEEFDIVGHSLGGMVGAFLAEHVADARLVSLEGNLVAPDAGASRVIATQDADSFTTHGHADVLASVAAESAVRRAWLEQVPARALHATAVAILAATNSDDMVERMRRRAPGSTLYVCGDRNHDKLRALDGYAGRCAVVADSGHFLLQDNPADTIAVIAGFLAGSEQPSASTQVTGDVTAPIWDNT